MNKVGPYGNTHETYHFYQLPICRPEKVLFVFVYFFITFTDIIFQYLDITMKEKFVNTVGVVYFTIIGCAIVLLEIFIQPGDMPSLLRWLYERLL